jgi:hypothetical protein
MQKKETEYFSHHVWKSTQKMYSKWIRMLNVKHQTIRPLEKNVEETLKDVDLDKNIFGYDPKSTSKKLTNGITSNQKASGQQSKQLTE